MIDYSKWSTQAIFNKVAKHLLKQGKRAKDQAWMDEGGCRCALGCLVPKDGFDKAYGFYYPKVCPLVSKNVTFDQDKLVSDLQYLHDFDECSPSRWPQKLRGIAREHGLEIPEFLRSK